MRQPAGRIPAVMGDGAVAEDAVQQAAPAVGRSCASCARGIRASLHVIVVADLQVGRVGPGHSPGGVWGHLCWRVSRF